MAAVAFCLTGLAAAAQYGGGTGTAADPYQIWTPEQMNAIGAEPNDWDKHFKLMADIELSAYDGKEGRPAFNVIAFGGTPPKSPFTGVFDGGGHKISHFTHRFSLFRAVVGPSAEIRNLGLIDLAVGGEDGGGLVGYSEGRIIDCYISGGAVGRGSFDVGGLVGYNGGRIERCYFCGTVSGWSDVGGLVGRNGTDTGVVRDCYSMGNVAVGSGSGGGLIGRNTGEVFGCYSTAAVSGMAAIGGLIGYNDVGGLVMCCYSTGSASGSDGCIGGLAGGNRDTIIHSYSTGAVSGPSMYTGGLVGRVSAGDIYASVVRRSFWDVSGSGQAESNGGTGMTTIEMRNIRTYLEAGWDFVGESENGTCEMWQMPEEGEGPVLASLHGYVPPQLQGSGTDEDPYLISDVWELGAIARYPQDAHYRLAASIDLTGTHWDMAVIPRFQGTFDGRGLTLTHLAITSVSYVGLFGRLESAAVVKDVALVDVNVVGGRYAGALAGSGAGTVTACYSTGSVAAVGGVAGQGTTVGGLIGMNSGVITDCRNEATVAGAIVGGVLGENRGYAARCANTGTVQSRNTDGCYSCVGGLVGWSRREAAVAQCCNRGAVHGDDSVIMGISGYTGGLVGSSRGAVTDCYSTGAVSAAGPQAGGLLGCNGGTLTHSYSAGIVTGYVQLPGGLTGFDLGIIGSKPVLHEWATDCFWDTQASSQSTSEGGVGKTTSEMWAAGTYLNAGWDFAGETDNGTGDIWWIDEGRDYPRLWWEAEEKDDGTAASDD